MPEDMSAGAWHEFLTEFGALFDSGPEVCITHRRFTPCLNWHDCVYSSNPDDVAAVHKYQQEEGGEYGTGTEQ